MNLDYPGSSDSAHSGSNTLNSAKYCHSPKEKEKFRGKEIYYLCTRTHYTNLPITKLIPTCNTM